MNDELYHWGLRRGEEKKGHKYTSRELIGTKNGKNKYRYIYENAKKKIQSLGSSEKKDKRVGLIIPIIVNRKKAAKTLDKIATKLISAVKKTASFVNGKRKTKELLDKHATKQNNYATRNELELQGKSAKKLREYKYIAKVKLPNGKYRYFYNKNELEAYYKEYGSKADKELLKRYGLKETPTLPDADAEVINNHYENGGINYRMNCYSCSIAYDLRRKGFDVEAIPDPDGLDQTSLVNCYKQKEIHGNPQPMDPEILANGMINDMKSQGNGAHGIIMVYWNDGSGHAMNWEVINGHAVIIDNQNQTGYNEEDMKVLMNYTACTMTPGAVTWMRTDDVEIDESALKYIQKNT